MFSRLRVVVWLVLLVALVFAMPVFAGGWAVITLDTLPTGVIAGEPFTVGFTVRQHGITPMKGLDPTITAELNNGDEFVVHAVPEGQPGHYTATLTFPKDGEWRWSIQAFSMDQRMPMLNVAAPIAGSPGEVVAKAEPVKSISIVWIVRVLALGIGVVAFVIASQRQSRVAIAMTAFCLFVGLGSFVTGAGAGSEVEAQAEVASNALSDGTISQVELGEQLFVAKGCITCHVNQRVTNSNQYWTIEMGAPNLSIYANDPDVLRTRLKDPSAVKVDTKMPNLELRREEIEALVAFINSK